MNLDKPAFAHHPALLGARLRSPEHKQLDSAREDTKEDEGDTSSVLDTELDATMGEETDASGHPAHTPSAPCRGNVTRHFGNSVDQRIDD